MDAEISGYGPKVRTSAKKAITVSKRLGIMLTLLLGYGLVMGTFGATDAEAQSYVQLQVLVPGEVAAPGTGSGKSGTPTSQTVGVPFDVTVRAVDANWNLVSSATSLIELTSSDETASLPAPVQMVGGVAHFTVALNASGQFEFQDQVEKLHSVVERY